MHNYFFSFSVDPLIIFYGIYTLHFIEVSVIVNTTISCIEFLSDFPQKYHERTDFDNWIKALRYGIILPERAVKYMRGEEYNMPTDIQFKDDLRKEEIRIENELELLENKEYDKLKKKLERDLKRVRESLQDWLVTK